LPSSPLTGVKRATPPIFFIPPNWVHGVDHRPSRWSGKAKLPLRPNLKNSLSADVAMEKSP
jgi:hypothetical protein